MLPKTQVITDSPISQLIAELQLRDTDCELTLENFTKKMIAVEQ